MPTPQFILDLREHVGHGPLWLSGITAVVVEDDRILLNRRSDNGRWALLHGIVEPGEQPADTVVREVQEETGVTVRPERITSVHTLPAFACTNGDQVQYLDIAFRCRPLSGEPRVNDDESLAVAWFPLDALPPLTPNDTLLLEKALADTPSPWFALG
ncbi:NUDIX hydrolase [Kitasatospora cineracea]|uniref:NUDIX hydrolase n=1 Tax=Kitasatospora cineracea TaxID=88074 RepID=UPI0033F87FA6